MAFLGREQVIYGLKTESFKNYRSKTFTLYHLYQSDHLSAVVVLSSLLL